MKHIQTLLALIVMLISIMTSCERFDYFTGYNRLCYAKLGDDTLNIKIMGASYYRHYVLKDGVETTPAYTQNKGFTMTGGSETYNFYLRTLGNTYYSKEYRNEEIEATLTTPYPDRKYYRSINGEFVITDTIESQAFGTFHLVLVDTINKTDTLVLKNGKFFVTYDYIGIEKIDTVIAN